MPSQAYKNLLDRMWDLHVRKNAGYAGADNPDAFANFRMCEQFGISAFDGCMVRLSDKYARVTSLLRNSSNEQVGESLRDTLSDLSAYALIAICLLDEQDAKPVEDIMRDLNRGWISQQKAMELVGADLSKGESYNVVVESWGEGDGPVFRLTDTCSPSTCCAAPQAAPHSDACRFCSAHS